MLEYTVKGDLTAFNISQFEIGVHCLEVPSDLKKILKQFIVTYSTDYIVKQKKIQTNSDTL